MNPGNVIWKQLTVMTKMACGARDAMTTEGGNGLIFKVGRAMTWIEVKLTPADTYTVELIKVNRKRERIVVESHEDVYVDSLNEIVYHAVNK